MYTQKRDYHARPRLQPDGKVSMIPIYARLPQGTLTQVGGVSGMLPFVFDDAKAVCRSLGWQGVGSVSLGDLNGDHTLVVTCQAPPQDIGPPWTDWKRIRETADLLGYGIERRPGPRWVLTRDETTTTPMSIVNLCAILESDLLGRRYPEPLATRV